MRTKSNGLASWDHAAPTSCITRLCKVSHEAIRTTDHWAEAGRQAMRSATRQQESGCLSCFRDVTSLIHVPHKGKDCLVLTDSRSWLLSSCRLSWTTSRCAARGGSISRLASVGDDNRTKLTKPLNFEGPQSFAKSGGPIHIIGGLIAWCFLRRTDRRATVTNHSLDMPISMPLLFPFTFLSSRQMTTSMICSTHRRSEYGLCEGLSTAADHRSVAMKDLHSSVPPVPSASIVASVNETRKRKQHRHAWL